MKSSYLQFFHYIHLIIKKTIMSLTQDELTQNIVEYFKINVFENHIQASLTRNARLKSYRINPIVVKYLSKVLEDEYSPLGVAKALYYPRVLGTSINTSFGTRIQNMFIDLNMAAGSLIKGMDIEFKDKTDNRNKWCQLKSGPNTINSEDVNPLLKKFTSTINLARTNRAFTNVRNTDFIVGVLYGEQIELSAHYRKIDQSHPVIIGKDFWHRITGFPNFYDGLVLNLQTLIDDLNTQDLINVGVHKLAKEIGDSELFSFNDA